ncbi:AAA family ATPase [Oscillibacter sp.]|uniref:ATP-dependent DNA helicase n=1 Tax=Oscillibacter sp. TaxID=1945593 RepID=UPI0028A2146D|nr:AAA family ATPase [Oscillibacter sp.]
MNAKTNPSQKQGNTVLDVLYQAAMSGDVYLPADKLLARCLRQQSRQTAMQIDRQIDALLEKKTLAADGERLYLGANHRYEQAAAIEVARRLGAIEFPVPATQLDAALAGAEAVLAAPLDESQREAVKTCLSHRMTIVTGGAGSGKTTMIRALHLANSILTPKQQTILCAPTGRAARNMAVKADHSAHTVHRALGKVPDSNFLDGVNRHALWKATNLVVIDEASMLTLEMLAGLLNQASSDCRVVLVGDPQQLQSVGAGNVLQDLLALGVPHVHLQGNHRQDRESEALLNNVQDFNQEGAVTLEFDDSFQLVKAYTDTQARWEIVALYGPLTAAGDEVQVLSPFRVSSRASARGLNLALQQIVNPPAGGKPELSLKPLIFRDRDKVLLTENAECHCNGDIGIISIRQDSRSFDVDFGGGVTGFHSHDLALFDLAYSLTIHKAQGSEYDTVIVPVIRDFGVMLSRNLLYTAISRAKRRLILVGDEDMVRKALESPPRPRYSTLAERVKVIRERRKAG